MLDETTMSKLCKRSPRVQGGGVGSMKTKPRTQGGDKKTYKKPEKGRPLTRKYFFFTKRVFKLVQKDTIKHKAAG